MRVFPLKTHDIKIRNLNIEYKTKLFTHKVINKYINIIIILLYQN